MDGSKTYLDGCFNGISTKYVEGAPWNNQPSNFFGTLSLNATPNDAWTLDYRTANGMGARSGVALSQLKGLQTYDTKGESTVLSESNNGARRKIACVQTLQSGAKLDKALDGQFLVNVESDGERTIDPEVGRGNPKKALGPVNDTTRHVVIPGLAPLGYHETTIEGTPTKIREIILYPPVIIEPR
jgi:hypothetical protein